MKKRLIVFCFLTLLCTPFAHAQIPGYMGKRCIIKATAYGMPLTGLLYSDEKAFDFNMRFGLGIDYVLSRNICIGISAEQINDIIYLDKLSTTPLGQQYPPRPTTYGSAANWYGYNLGLNMKFFLLKASGSLAPFGKYFILEYLRNRVNVSDDGRYYPSGKTDINQITTSTILFGMGTQRVLFNRLVIDASLKYGINFYGLARIKKYEVREDYEPVYAACSSKMFSDYMFSLGIGIGILAF